METNQIKWIKDENPEETGTYGQIYYKGVRLDLSAETIQSIYFRSFSEEEVQISSSYGNNIQFSANTISTPHHFFIEAIKSQSELRDTKIDNIIN